MNVMVVELIQVDVKLAYHVHTEVSTANLAPPILSEKRLGFAAHNANESCSDGHIPLLSSNVCSRDHALELTSSPTFRVTAPERSTVSDIQRTSRSHQYQIHTTQHLVTIVCKIVEVGLCPQQLATDVATH